jgi:polar amino acid transport system substrate-binding protein
MTSNHNSSHKLIFGLIVFWALLFISDRAFSQNEKTMPLNLRVGVLEAPPLCMKTADNRWEGFSVELWQEVAKGMGISSEFLEFASMDLLLDAFIKHEIDVIPALPVRERLVSVMDYSQSYLKSGLSIAVPYEGFDYAWTRVIESVFSKQIFKAFGLLLLMSLTAGMILWLFERRRNIEMFGKGTIKGIGHGIWWAMVTMTTVGYGDKAPITIGGRTIAIIWMMFSIIFISSFTANITTTLTIGELRGKVRGFSDLFHARVGTISRSEGFDFLSKQGIAVIPFEGLREGLQAVADKKIDAFVLNEEILKYVIKSEFPGQVQALPESFDEYFVGIALQPNSPIRKRTNKTLLKFMNTENWTALRKRYIE